MKAAIIAGCVVLSVLHAPGAHATEYQGNLPKPVQKLAMFDEANKKDIPVIIRIDNKRYEILEVFCIGQQKKPNDGNK